MSTVTLLSHPSDPPSKYFTSNSGCVKPGEFETMFTWGPDKNKLLPTTNWLNLLPPILETSATVLPIAVASNILLSRLLKAEAIAFAISSVVPVGLKNLPSDSPGLITTLKSAVIVIFCKLADTTLFTVNVLEPVTETVKSTSNPLRSLSTTTNLLLVALTWNFSKSGKPELSHSDLISSNKSLGSEFTALTLMLFVPSEIVNISPGIMLSVLNSYVCLLTKPATYLSPWGISSVISRKLDIRTLTNIV